MEATCSTSKTTTQMTRQNLISHLLYRNRRSLGEGSCGTAPGRLWATCRKGGRRTSGIETLHAWRTSRCVACTSHEWPVSCQNESGTCTRWNLRTSCCVAMKSRWLIFASRSSRGRLSACSTHRQESAAYAGEITHWRPGRGGGRKVGMAAILLCDCRSRPGTKQQACMLAEAACHRQMCIRAAQESASP